MRARLGAPDRQSQHSRMNIGRRANGGIKCLETSFLTWARRISSTLLRYAYGINKQCSAYVKDDLVRSCSGLTACIPTLDRPQFLGRENVRECVCVRVMANMSMKFAYAVAHVRMHVRLCIVVFG
eukprot:4334306-Pleurochrysis_carterae.AAC.1